MKPIDALIELLGRVDANQGAAVLVNTEEFKFGKHKAFNFTLTCNVHYLSDEELELVLSQIDSESNTKIN